MFLAVEIIHWIVLIVLLSTYPSYARYIPYTTSPYPTPPSRTYFTSSYDMTTYGYGCGTTQISCSNTFTFKRQVATPASSTTVPVTDTAMAASTTIALTSATAKVTTRLTETTPLFTTADLATLATAQSSTQATDASLPLSSLTLPLATESSFPWYSETGFTTTQLVVLYVRALCVVGSSDKRVCCHSQCYRQTAPCPTATECSGYDNDCYNNGYDSGGSSSNYGYYGLPAFA
jgi:hypothetical protein